MKTAYIAGKYRGTSKYRIINKCQVALNIFKAYKVGREVAKLGIFPVIPHCNTAFMGNIQPAEFWLNGTLDLMCRASDIVLLIPGWGRSEGAVGEARQAGKMLALPVYCWPSDKERLIELSTSRKEAL